MSTARQLEAVPSENQLTIEELVAIPARSDERGEGWQETEPSRFARLAHRLWSSLVAREELRIG